jgi:hypothetical protein
MKADATTSRDVTGGMRAMTRSYQAEVYSFGSEPLTRRMTMDDAARCISGGEAAAVLLDTVPAEGIDRWWIESAFPDLTRHRNFPSAATSGVAIGGIQRLEKENLIAGLIDYFCYAGKVNDKLKHTQFVELCVDELNAEPVFVGAWGELPLASRREFVANPNGSYSVGPHCDAIHFGRDANWPIKADINEGGDQLSMVLTVGPSSDAAGIVLWDLRPESRAELDELLAEFASSREIRRLAGRRSVAVRARAGQMTILNTRLLHAVEQCVTPRRTIGAFLIWHGGGWHMFH